MRLLLVGVAVGLAAAAAPPAPLPPASQLLAVSPPLYHGSFPLHFRLPADAQAGTDVVSIKVVRPSLASTRGALLSSLLHVDISPEPASAPHCSLEAFTHGAGLSTRRAGATTGDALRIALPPTGDDALLLVRCAAPAPWSLSSSPSSAAFSVTTSLVVEPRLRVRLMSGLALLALAPSLARCAPAYYATSMLASAILLALLVGGACGAARLTGRTQPLPFLRYARLRIIIIIIPAPPQCGCPAPRRAPRRCARSRGSSPSPRQPSSRR